MTELRVRRFANHYRCPCGEEWEDEWCCACNDKCPRCNAEIEPHESVEEASFLLTAGTEDCPICDSPHEE